MLQYNQIKIKERMVKMNQPLTKYSTNKQSKKLWKGIIASLLCGSMLVSITALSRNSSQSLPAFVQAQSNQQVLTDFESAIIGATDVAKDAVVSIVNKQAVYRPTFESFYYGIEPRRGREEITEPEEELLTAGEGSGVIYKIEGNTAYVVTNYHVIDKAKELDVILSDGTVKRAEYVGSDELTDLAVLKIEASNVKTAIQFADSSQLRIGSLAIAIGSPLGSQYSNSVTQGIISGVERPIGVDLDYDGEYDWYESLLQTDAAINPGNSGGALVNKNGELIGINSNKFASVAVEGMGFAIPSNDVQRIIQQLEVEGKVTRPILGIRTKDVEKLSERSRDILQLPSDVITGVAIAEVMDNSVAEKSGVEAYDVITHIDGSPIDNLLSLRQTLYKHNIGDTIELTILREGKEQRIKVTLESEEPSRETLE